MAEGREDVDIDAAKLGNNYPSSWMVFWKDMFKEFIDYVSIWLDSAPMVMEHKAEL